MEYKKPKKDGKEKDKKRKFNPDVVPMQSKTYATLHRTLRGTRK